MRKTIFLYFLMASSIIASAQSSYTDIQKKVMLAMANYSDKNANYAVLKKVVSSFEKSKKIKDSYLEKDNLGIAIFLSEQNPELDIFPARYTYEDAKINFSALRNKNTKKPIDEMREYVKIYIEDFTQLNKTTIFKKLLFNEPGTEGIFSSNATEQIVKEPYTTTFVRGDDTWMYAVSTGNQGIILYAFKMTISGENISEKSKN